MTAILIFFHEEVSVYAIPDPPEWLFGEQTGVFVRRVCDALWDKGVPDEYLSDPLDPFARAWGDLFYDPAATYENVRVLMVDGEI